MAIQSTRFYTASKDSAFSINVEDNVMSVTVKVGTGATCLVQGNFPFNGSNSDPIQLSAGDTLTLSGKPGAPIDGITFTPAGGGNVLVVMEF